jgi:hypothetical protein
LSLLYVFLVVFCEQRAKRSDLGSAVSLKVYRSEEICASILINVSSEPALTLPRSDVFVYVYSLVKLISVPPLN